VKARVLPPEEWSRLDGTEMRVLLPFLKTSSAKVLVVEQDGEIVGRWLATPIWHVEGLWIDPAHRGLSGVARRLWAGMRRALRAEGVDGVVTGAVDDDVRRLLKHAGASQLPGDWYVLPIGAR